uniref:Copper transporter n=1 Tax=Leucosporidium scottii TaxID=5278 RepID=A0A0H5FS26_9BASI|nr:hypothetical protein [Leucosporidium scottii]
MNSTPVVPDLSTWADIIVGILFFAAFGFGTEALALYSRVTKLLKIRQASSVQSGDESSLGNVAKVGIRSDGRLESGNGWEADGALENSDLRPFHVLYPQQDFGAGRGVKVVVEQEVV